ncbi:hypothetical protein F2P56_023113 [Juglans regia]|uniref:Uncharacterized protein n=1 Tax=Juglans regia TaxID=51240 RepID=A0A833URT5_JUGRE|nr:hypothetical protein F2P56_023113 [Juglans regia]
MHAEIVDTLSMEALTHQRMDITGQKCWQATGIATVVLTTTPADQAASSAVQIKVITLAWQALEFMNPMGVSHLDGNLVTGFATEWDVECTIMLTERSASVAKQERINLGGAI